MTSTRIEQMQQRLNSALQPQHLMIDDQSALHAGHAGAQDGRGHYAVLIVSDQFRNKSLLQRHRLVYEALGDMMQKSIHALSIKSLTIEEHKTHS